MGRANSALYTWHRSNSQLQINYPWPEILSQNNWRVISSLHKKVSWKRIWWREQKTNRKKKHIINNIKYVQIICLEFRILCVIPYHSPWRRKRVTDVNTFYSYYYYKFQFGTAWMVRKEERNNQRTLHIPFLYYSFHN